MDEMRMLEIAAEEGFENAAIINTEDLVFIHSFRALCEENDCGNYNRNYGCPPYCGTPQEMEDRVRAYRKAIVFQSKNFVNDAMDGAETRPLKKKHIQKTRSAMKHLEQEGLQMNGFPAMCGPCNYCAVCALVEGKPCVHEDMRFSCLSAYCISVNDLAKSCGMEIEWSGNVAYFFSMYVFDKK